MKAILAAINAKYIHSNLAVYSLRKYAEVYADYITLSEYTINNYMDDILMDLYKQKPDFLAVSCYIWNIDMVKELLREIKKVLPNLIVWVGGPEVSYEVERFLKENPYVDGVMIGEGEQTFLELMEHYIGGTKSLSDILGIAYRKEGVLFFNAPRRMLMDLSDIPFPYDDLDTFANKIVYYESSRGCPFSCSYCLSSIEKGVRLRNIELVKKELQLFLDKNIPQVKFIDRTFNCNHKHAMEIWQYIYEHDNGITNFHFEISADLLTEEELGLLNRMRVGLVQLEIGVQSTNEKTIHAINRTMNLDKLSYAVKRVQQGKNIHQHLDLIAGLPFEDYESFRHSFNDVYAMAPNQLQLGFLKVLKGSEMYVEQEVHHILYKGQAPYEVMATKWIPYDDILQLKQVEDMVEVYYNSDQFTHTLRFLMHYYKTPFDFYQQLGTYYEKEGLQGFHHSRIARYNILLDFVERTKPQIIEPLKELLVYDLYLRENLKSRPSFAKDQTKYKEKYHNFYGIIQQMNKEGLMELDGKKNVLPDYKEYQARQMARMTHLECFSYDLATLEETGEVKAKEQHILFDYKKRNPLNQEVRTKVVVDM